MPKELKLADVKPLIELARSMTADGGVEGHARRAFELAHRAWRVCETAAEHASRTRWALLQAPGIRPADPVQRFAYECAVVRIHYPVLGEAAVYAAMLGAADCAHLVAVETYKAWLDMQPKAPPIVQDGNPGDRIAPPLAEGCYWTQPPSLED